MDTIEKERNSRNSLKNTKCIAVNQYMVIIDVTLPQKITDICHYEELAQNNPLYLHVNNLHPPL